MEFNKKSFRNRIWYIDFSYNFNNNLNLPPALSPQSELLDSYFCTALHKVPKLQLIPSNNDNLQTYLYRNSIKYYKLWCHYVRPRHKQDDQRPQLYDRISGMAPVFETAEFQLVSICMLLKS